MIDVILPSSQVPISIVSPLLAALFGSFVGAYLQHVLEHTKRVRREVFRPLYNEISPASRGGLPYDFDTDNYQSKWSEYTDYQRMLVGNYMIDKLDRYESAVDSCNVDINDLDKDRSGLWKFLAEIHNRFPEECFADDTTSGSSRFKQPQSASSMNDWTFCELYTLPIFAANSPEELETLVKGCHETRTGKDPVWDYWDEVYPDWNEELYEISQEYSAEIDDDISKATENYDLAVELADSLKSTLENKATLSLRSAFTEIIS